MEPRRRPCLTTTTPEPLPAAPPSAHRHSQRTQPAPRKGPRPPGWWQRTVVGFPVWMVLAFAAVVAVVFAVIARSGDPGSDAADRVQTRDPVTDRPSLQPDHGRRRDDDRAVHDRRAHDAGTHDRVTDVGCAVDGRDRERRTHRPRAHGCADDGAAGGDTAARRTCRHDHRPRRSVHLRESMPARRVHAPRLRLPAHRFVCEFSDGSRYTFHFNRQEVERACATGDPADSITIEVDGVRSATYRRP